MGFVAWHVACRVTPSPPYPPPPKSPSLYILHIPVSHFPRGADLLLSSAFPLSASHVARVSWSTMPVKLRDSLCEPSVETALVVLKIPQKVQVGVEVRGSEPGGGNGGGGGWAVRWQGKVLEVAGNLDERDLGWWGGEGEVDVGRLGHGGEGGGGDGVPAGGGSETKADVDVDDRRAGEMGGGGEGADARVVVRAAVKDGNGIGIAGAEGEGEGIVPLLRVVARHDATPNSYIVHIQLTRTTLVLVLWIVASSFAVAVWYVAGIRLGAASVTRWECECEVGGR
ncbi:hypothetical protein HDU93_001504 [Gonapodya sp. JEL0774]|nr:hypothetical protein HDU93_001504 [Gonapodya sp. JEL0774]